MNQSDAKEYVIKTLNNPLTRPERIKEVVQRYIDVYIKPKKEDQTIKNAAEIFGFDPQEVQ